MSTQVLICQLPRLPAEAIQAALGDEADLDVGVTLEEGVGLVTVIRDQEPDLVLLGEPLARDEILWQQVLIALPTTQVLELRGSGRNGQLYRLTPEREFLGELDPDGLARWIRHAVRPRPFDVAWPHGGPAS